MAAGPKITADMLSGLLQTLPHKTVLFTPNDTRDERVGRLAELNPTELSAIRKILTAYILDDCDLPHDCPLIDLMATADSEHPDEEKDWWRHSYDWRLTVYTAASGYLYDFIGWPGDNESGAGLFQHSGLAGPYHPFVVIYTNSDQKLKARDSANDEVVARFGVLRQEPTQ